MTNITGGGINNSTETVADFEKCGIWLGQLHFYGAQHSSGSVVTSTVPDCFPCLPSAERTTLLIKSSLLWEPLAALFFWDSETTQQKKIVEFFFGHFLSVPFPSWFYEQLCWADLSTAARFCWPSPPTEGWRPSSWRGPCLPCGSPRSPSCSFLRACAAAPSWPSTSRTPLRTPALRHLNKLINDTKGQKDEYEKSRGWGSFMAIYWNSFSISQYLRWLEDK